MARQSGKDDIPLGNYNFHMHSICKGRKRVKERQQTAYKFPLLEAR